VLGYGLGWPDVWFRTVAVLVVACPCALILATPAAVLASMAWLARHGVLIKGGAALERLAACDTFAFDKTGTLTLGRPELASLVAFGSRTETDVLRLAATAEATSTHPLAAAVARAAANRGVSAWTATESVALPGAGVRATFYETPDGPQRAVLVGNRRLLAEQGVALDAETTAALDTLDGRGETPLIVVGDGQVAGLVGTRDTVRPEAHDVVHDLKHLGFKQVAMLTGDRASAAAAVAQATHIKTVESELRPADKARWVEEAQAGGKRVAMVGDGINDAPALAAAYVGIALGGIGADLAAEAGDLVVLGQPLTVLPDLVRLSRGTVRVIRQNIIGFAFGLNAVAMTSAAVGVIGPVAAALLHQAGSLLVLLNSMRLLAFGDWAELPPVRRLRALGGAIRRLDERLDPGLAVARLLACWRVLAALGFSAAVLAYLTWGFTAIGPGEVGLVRRFGRHVATLGPGLHLRWPPPVEAITRLAPDRLRSVEIGFRTAGLADPGALRWESGHGRGVSARAEEESLLLTGDGQLVELTATAQYRLDARHPAALRAFAFEVADPEGALRPLAESAVRTVVSRGKLDTILTSGRRAAERAATSLLQERANAARLGVVITSVAFQDVHPPLTVVDAYRDVSRAESDRQRRTNEGLTYQSEALAAAQGQAAVTVNRAEAERAAQVDRASGESDAFRSLSAARAGQPWLTDRRLYWDLIVEWFAGKRKLVLDPGRAAPRHLIVPDVPGGNGTSAPLPPESLIGPPKPPP
jgi:P-type Cu+ transporter